MKKNLLGQLLKRQIQLVADDLGLVHPYSTPIETTRKLLQKFTYSQLKNSLNKQK